MKILPKGKYVLFGRWDDDSSHLQTYGIFEREEYVLEASCDRDKMYHAVSVSDDKEMLETTLREINMLNSELAEAEDEMKDLKWKYKYKINSLKEKLEEQDKK